MRNVVAWGLSRLFYCLAKGVGGPIKVPTVPPWKAHTEAWSIQGPSQSGQVRFYELRLPSLTRDYERLDLTCPDLLTIHPPVRVGPLVICVPLFLDLHGGLGAAHVLLASREQRFP